MEKKGDSEKSKKLPIEEGCLSKGSVIVYVWRQKDTEIVAEQLNGAGIRGGVVCYHGGMDAGARNRAQSKVSCFSSHTSLDMLWFTDNFFIFSIHSSCVENQGYVLPLSHSASE